jgi:pimeloyl-ACP methyl ester carboxylesterase
VHEFLRDVPLHDVWVIRLRGGGLGRTIQDLHALLTFAGLQTTNYVGESIGGILGAAFAVRWPERLKSLTICNSPTTIRPAGEKALSGPHGNVKNALAQSGSRGWGRLLIEQKIISGKNPAHIEWVVNEWSKTPTHVLQGITRTLDGADTTPLLPQITVPTLLHPPRDE